MTATPFQVTMSVCAEPLTNFSNYRSKPALLNHLLLTAVLASLSLKNVASPLLAFSHARVLIVSSMRAKLNFHLISFDMES
ncbi:MAG: hypothetical protein K1X61_08350 [Chitinophagales bacterium]|nr:hypothetical protein [Chitinophagales bacterium]